jgi:hypothetical protein
LSRLRPAFDEAFAKLDRYVDFAMLEPVALDRLARVQLGSGLIALKATTAS